MQSFSRSPLRPLSCTLGCGVTNGPLCWKTPPSDAVKNTLSAGAGCEDERVVVRVQTVGLRLRVVGHVGEVHARVGRPHDGATVGAARSAEREQLVVLHRPGEEHLVRLARGDATTMS